MSSKLDDASSISDALLSAWISLDAQFSLPALIVEQIDQLRNFDCATRPIRDFYREVCREGLLLGIPWHHSVRKNLPKSQRSEYLDWLFDQNLGLFGLAGEGTVIFDPAYHQWARLKYEEMALWMRYLAQARNASIADCSSVLESAPAPLAQSWTARSVKALLAESFKKEGLPVVPVQLATGGFSVRVPLELKSYYLECQIRDIPVLRRRIIPFAFEIASSADGEPLRLCSTDADIWPGAFDYRRAGEKHEFLSTVFSIFAIFAKTVRATLVDR